MYCGIKKSIETKYIVCQEKLPQDIVGYMMRNLALAEIVAFIFQALNRETSGGEKFISGNHGNIFAETFLCR